MRILVLAFALLPAAAIAADRDPPRPRAKECRTELQLAGRPAPEPVRPQTLDKMPPAEAYYPVMRIVDGCEKPVKVRETRRR